MKPIEQAKNGGYDLLRQAEERLASGEIDEQGWYEAVQAVVTPAYVRATTPWSQSGKSGDAAGWDYARSHIADAIDRNGSFLDVGCANGYLLECLLDWCGSKGISIDPYGLDISPELVGLARERLPAYQDRWFVSNAMDWSPPMRFDFIRSGLEYVPLRRQPDLVERLLGWLAPGGRLIVGVYNEEREERLTEELLRSWGHAIAGSSERLHSDPRLSYRLLWIDAPR